MNQSKLHIFTIAGIFIFFLLILSPLITPIFLNSHVYMYGDFVTNILPDSSNEILKRSFYVIDENTSRASFEHLRYSPLYTLILLIGTAFNRSEAFAIACMNLIVIFLGYLGLYLLYQRFYGFKRIVSYVMFTAITAFYFFNFYSITRINHIFLWHTYVLLPLLLYTGWQYIENKNFRYLLAYSLIIATWGVIPHGLLYMLLIHLLFSLKLLFATEFRRLFYFNYLSALIVILVNIHFIVGLFTSAGGYPILLTVSQLQFLSENGSIRNTLGFANNWWIFTGIESTVNNWYYIVSGLLLSAMFISLGVISLAQKGNRSYKRSGVVITLVLIGLVTIISVGMNLSINEAVIYFLEDQNRLGVVSVFREWGRIALLLPILMLYLFFSYADSEVKTPFISFIVKTFLSLIIIINLIQLPVAQYLYQIHNPITVPNDYYELEKEIDKTGKTLWNLTSDPINVNGNQVAVWDRTKVPTKIPEFISNSYHQTFGSLPLALTWLRDHPSEKLLRHLNITDQVNRYDILSTEAYDGDLYTASEVNNTLGQSYILPSNYAYLTDPAYDVSNFVMLFQMGLNVAPLKGEAVYKGRYLLMDLNDSLDSVVLNELIEEKKVNLLTPGNDVRVFDPWKEWSSGTTRSVLHAEFNQYIEQFGVVNYQSELSDFILFTNAPPTAKGESYINLAEYNLLGSRDRELFKKENDRIEFSTKYTISNSEDGVSFTLFDRTSGWKSVETPMIPVEEKKLIKVSSTLKLEDVYEPHIRIEYYNEEEELIGDSYVTNIASYNDVGLFDYEFEYFISQKGTKYVKVVFWHSDKNVSSDGSTLTFKNIKIEEVVAELEYPQFDYKESLIADDSGSDLYARILFSPQGNQLRFTVGERIFNLDTSSSLTAFKWVKVGTLPPGEHKLMLSNIAGLNAVDALVLINKDDLEKEREYLFSEGSYKYDHVLYKVSSNGEYELPIRRGVDYTVIYTDQNGVVYKRDDVVSNKVEVSELKESTYAWIVPVTEALYDKASNSTVKINRINPNRFEGSVKVLEAGEVMIFNERFDTNWELRLTKDGSKQTILPLEAFGLVNGYIIDQPGEYQFEIVYANSDIIFGAKVVSVILYVITLIVLIRLWVKGDEKKITKAEKKH